MSKGNKEEQKWLLGESLNQYDRSLKEELGKVEKRNREQNHKISALINAFDDDYIKKEEENTNISLDYSKEGIVIVDDIKGNTLVNNVKDSNKELVLNGDIDTQGVNVTLEDTVDNGKVDVVLEGNTEVNLSKTKDPIMITHKFDDINSNNGKLQTTVNGVTTVNDSPGKVDVKDITGDTLVNHVSNGSEELILNGDIDTSGYSNVTLTEGIDGGKVDVSLEGNTMVNVCDQEEPVAITKSYTVETGNHVALQGEYDGKCRPNIYGNTLVNLCTVENSNVNGTFKRQLIYPVSGTITIICYNIKNFKIGYSKEQDGKWIGNTSISGYKNVVTLDSGVTIKELIAGHTEDYNNITYEEFQNLNIVVLEGDYTNKPIPDYFTGMKSSFEDKLVPENLINYNEVVCNYNEAKNYQSINTKANQIYTVVVNILENTCDKGVWFSAYEFIGQSTINDYYLGDVREGNIKLASQGQTGIFKLRIGYTQLGSKGTRFALFSEKSTSGSFKATAYVVEGDYTNYDFTDYDSTKGGKYRVDYKVTGKNKLNIELLRNQSNFSIEYTNYGFWYYPLKVEKGKTYSISVGADSLITNGEMTPYLCITEKKDYNDSSNRAWMNHVNIGFNKTQTIQSVDGYLYIQISNGMEYVNYLLDNIGYIQLEEGTTATDYEPYKESIKTLYLNSPLLEGDTIEQSGNNIMHNHRYGKVVLDGSNYVPASEKTLASTGNYRWRFFISNVKNSTSTTGLGICDKYPIVSPTETWNSIEGITQNNDGNKIVLYLDKYKDGSDASKQALINELSTNPITFIYKKETPTQETISTNDNLLLDSYTNGHLDVDTIIPIDKVEFNDWSYTLKYLFPSTEYIIQFESDNVGKLYYMYTNGAYSNENSNIVKGLNKFTLTTPSEVLYNNMVMCGIGFNASKIVVTPKVDNDFGYFKGMKSVGECEDLEIVSNNKNLVDLNNISLGNGCVSIEHEDDCIIATFRGTQHNRFNMKLSNEILQLLSQDKTLLLSYDIEVLEPSNYNISEYTGYSTGCISYPLTSNNHTSKIRKDTIEIGFHNGAIEISPTKIKFYNIQIEEIKDNSNTSTDYTAHKQNKQTLTHEPLRGLPNGVCDKYVIIDGKWYIERNCICEIFDGSEDENWVLSGYNSNRVNGLTFRIKRNTPGSTGSSICTMLKCDKLKNITPKEAWGSNSDDTEVDGSFSGIATGTKAGDGIDIRIPKKILPAESILGFRQYLQNNPITVVYQLATPTYEPIDYNPFEVYTDITHISNNSTIPCNMVIKNTGYNTISLKENTKYTAYVNNKNNVSLTYKIDNNAIAVNSSNKFTFTTPSTLVDKTIRIASKGNKIENLMIVEGTPQNDPIGYFDGLKSSYECEKITDVNDENFGKYKVDTRVKGENFESTQTVYLNSPLLKGDKIIWKDNKLQHYHKMKTIVFDGSDDERWRRQEDLDTNNTQRYYIPNTTVKLNSLLINDVLPIGVSGRDDLTYLYIHNEVKRFDVKKLKTDTRWNDVTTLKKYLQQNPITVVYELATPYYEEISEYPLKFSSIANCSLSTTSNIQVSNISFNIYEETLPYLYNDKKYYITFNSDISKEIIINLGGSELIYTTKVGFNKVEITTPSNSNNMLTFNGQGVNINNVKVTQQNIDSYFEGMKSVGECEDLEIVSNNNDNTLSNKQTMTHEPLRGLPNGVRDKYVIIDGKWYIERNTIQLRMDSQFIQNKKIFTYVSQNYPDVIGFSTPNNWFKWNSSLVCDNLVYDGHRNISAGSLISNQEKIFVYDYIFITLNKNKVSTLNEAGFREYLKNNPTKIIAEAQPTYEPIDYNPFEVYTDTTYISNNSTIPCNMVIKNTGYNCILKPNTKYTVVTNTQGSISAKIGSTKADSTSNVFTIITPSTLTDNVLRLSGKGLTTKDIMLLEGDKTNYIPKYFTGMESVFEQEYDEEKNKYKVNVKVTDGNKENNITFYINEPLRGVGDIKDKVYVKEDKVVVERNCAEKILNGTENWKYDTTSSSQEVGRFGFNNIGMKGNRSLIVCDKYAFKTNYTMSSYNYEGTFTSVGGNVLFLDTLLNKLETKDLNGFKQWLQNNPTTVVYQLATPVYEEVECDLSKLMLENYENSSLILNSNIPPTVDVRYKGEAPIVSATKELSSNVESTTTDINENIIPYMCDMDYRIVELQLKNASTQGLEVNVLGLDSEDVLFNNRKANKIFNPSYEMLKRDILSKRYSTDEYKYRLERYLLANKISNEEYNELEELINGR